jgi:hypothetical protein
VAFCVVLLAKALSGSRTGCSGVSPGFESPPRRDISGREARQKERRVNDETQKRVVTAVAAEITFALSRLVTQRF